MKIITLKAENVKRLRAVEITPDGNTVVIAGRNAQGKSSVLDSIWMALCGADGAKETTRPIRDGEEKASVTLDLGELLVTRKWTAAGTTLEVSSREGARYPSPQTMLDKLVGRLSFDPLHFAQQAPREQLATLLSVVKLPFDPDDLAAERAGVYAQRTDVNREVKRVEALLSEIPKPAADTPDEEVSAAAIADELGAAVDQEQRRNGLRRDLELCSEHIERLATELAQTRAREAETLASFEAMPDPVDVDAIRARMLAADETNAAVRSKHERERLEAEAKQLGARSGELSEKLDKIDESKAKAIADAKMPLDGLSFDEDGVLYQGVPFSQSSASERLRVGIAIAMALNPQIRVIRITDGSLLDRENLDLIDEMAADHDFQVWLERVDESGEVGITIEDGQVVTAAVAEVAA